MARSLHELDDEDLGWYGNGYRYNAEAWFESKARRDFPDTSIPGFDLEGDEFGVGPYLGQAGYGDDICAWGDDQCPVDVEAGKNSSKKPTKKQRAAQSRRDRARNGKGRAKKVVRRTRKNFVKSQARLARRGGFGVGINKRAVRIERGFKISSYARKGEEDGVRMVGSDILAAVTIGGTAPPVGAELYNFKLSPLSFTNTRLAVIGGIFQKFRPNSIRFRFEHSCPTTTPGQLLHYCDYDSTDNYTPIDNTFAAIQKAAAHKGAVPFGVWEDKGAIHKVDDPTQAFYTEQTGEERLWSAGKYHLFVSAPPPANTALGVLYIDYDISFWQMSLDVAAAEDGTSSDDSYTMSISMNTGGATIADSTVTAARVWTAWNNAGTVTYNTLAEGPDVWFQRMGGHIASQEPWWTIDLHTSASFFTPGGAYYGPYIVGNTATGATIIRLYVPWAGRWRITATWSTTANNATGIATDPIWVSTPLGWTLHKTLQSAVAPSTSGAVVNLSTKSQIFDIPDGSETTPLEFARWFNSASTASYGYMTFIITWYEEYLPTMNSRKAVLQKFLDGTISYDDLGKELRKADGSNKHGRSKYVLSDGSQAFTVIENSPEYREAHEQLLHGPKGARARAMQEKVDPGENKTSDQFSGTGKTWFEMTLSDDDDSDEEFLQREIRRKAYKLRQAKRRSRELKENKGSEREAALIKNNVPTAELERTMPTEAEILVKEMGELKAKYDELRTELKRKRRARLSCPEALQSPLSDEEPEFVPL